MRVLQVMECTIGGTRRHLRDLVAGLRARGVEVEVACAVLREPRMREDLGAMAAAGVVVHELPMVRAISPLRDAWHALVLAGWILDRRFDVIHTHSSKAGALGRAAGFLCSGAVRIHTPHTYAASFEGGTGQGGVPPGPLRLILAVERLLGRVTDRIVHVSEGERREGQGLGVIAPERARVVPNGIDPRPFSAPSGGRALRQALGLPAGARVVGTVGLLNDAKGHDLLVESLARLPADVHALLVGHGEREPALRAQAQRLGLAARLHITGWRDDLAACLDAMDVFVLPSRWEGLSYALLEALAAGRPCVSTEVNGSRDVLDARDGEPACGIIVPREDPAALAAALQGLLGDPARARALAAAGPARVAGHFTVERMVDATLEVYRDALTRGRSRR